MNSQCSCGSDAGCSGPKNPQLAEILTKYVSQNRELLIPILQETQQQFKYLSRQNMVEIAEHVGIPVSKVFGVVTFYNQFKLVAPGKHVIQVCRGTACHVRGSDQILRTFESELGIKAGETTKDNQFSLDIVACLGSCSIAPVITIDGVFHGRLVPKDAERLLKATLEGEKK